tara:strand:- start:249 stop:476 length:228 start_codon:yes stop_codon:yes gene_type:complete
MRSLKNTHKWLSNINEERKGLIKNLKRIEKRLDILQHKEDRLVKDLEALVKKETQPPPTSSLGGSGLLSKEPGNK